MMAAILLRDDFDGSALRLLARQSRDAETAHIGMIAMSRA
jgi:hypothetical protein